MSSKEDILKRIHANTRQQYEMPDLSLNAIVYEDKLNTFIDVLKAALKSRLVNVVITDTKTAKAIL